MESSNIPPNNSHQHLMNGEDSDSLDTRLPSLNNLDKTDQGISRAQWITVFILCFVNLINYMDRYTIAGIIDDISKEYQILDDKAGLLQTAFVLSYMVFAPVFGYLGDRYSRRTIMAFGVFLWSLTTLLGSFMNTYGWFIMFRALVGIGEASYSTIAPTIISDLFVKDVRARMLALFYFAIPVGSGLGYIVGSETAKALDSWRWALRVTPVLGAIAVVLILFVIRDPERGESEGHTSLSPTSWSDDLKGLLKNQSFMLSTGGFMCVSFVAGALAWWGPNFILLGEKLQPNKENVKLSDISYKFGIITMVSGLIGVPLGQFMAQRLKLSYPRADPLICAFGLLLSTPFIFFAMILSSVNSFWCFTFIFIGELLLNLNWAIVADMLLYVVVPTRRSTAEAFQILISHMFGDAGSPYLIGVISEALKGVLRSTQTESDILLPQINGSVPKPELEVSFHALQYALFTTSFVEILGSIFFLLTAIYIVKNKSDADQSCNEKYELKKNLGEEITPTSLPTLKLGTLNGQPRNMYADLTNPD